MAGLPNAKTPQDFHSLPPLSPEPLSVSDEGTDSSLTENRDRKLRNQIILLNAAAWVVIGLALSYFFL
jgi:hypothetical protein